MKSAPSARRYLRRSPLIGSSSQISRGSTGELRLYYIVMKPFARQQKGSDSAKDYTQMREI